MNPLQKVPGHLHAVRQTKLGHTQALSYFGCGPCCGCILSIRDWLGDVLDPPGTIGGSRTAILEKLHANAGTHGSCIPLGMCVGAGDHCGWGPLVPFAFNFHLRDSPRPFVAEQQAQRRARCGNMASSLSQGLTGTPAASSLGQATGRMVTASILRTAQGMPSGVHVAEWSPAHLKVLPGSSGQCPKQP